VSRTRVTAFAVVLVAAACSSSGETTTTQPLELSSPGLPTTTTTVAVTTTTAAPALWEAPTCLDLGTNADDELPYAPYGDEFIVDCGGPHTHEVYFVEALQDGPEAPFPAGLADRLWPGCYAVFTDRMGFPSSQSTLNLTLYLPDESEWAAGERYHGCVLDQPGTQVVYRPLVGSVFDHPDDYRWEVAVGSCFAEVDLTALVLAELVSCDAIHTIEATGEVELAPPEAEYPGRDELVALGDETCQKVMEEYAAQDLEDLSVIAFAYPVAVEQGEWEAGGHSVQCYVVGGTPEQGLLLMRGSLGEGTLEVLVRDETVTA
jgi:Septum formation